MDRSKIDKKSGGSHEGDARVNIVWTGISAPVI